MVLKACFLQPLVPHETLWQRFWKKTFLMKLTLQFGSVQSVVSDSLRPHESQHAGPPCPSPSQEFTQTHVHRVRDAIQPSHPRSSPSPPAPNPSKSSPMSQLFSWGGQSTGVSALALFLPKKSQGWSHLEWTGWISLQSKGLSRVFSNTTLQKHQFFGAQPSSQSNLTSTHDYWKNHSLD